MKYNANSRGELILFSIVFGLIVAVGLAMLLTWPVMLLFGALASMTGWPCAISFWQTFVVVLIAKLLTAQGSTD